jgi:CheY-like chemotaxis protein
VARGQEETLLLVEDEAGVRAVAQAVLARHGYHVLEAPDGPRAFELWRAHKDEIALVITDMVMPGGLTGRQLVGAIRRESPDLRVVYMSGYDPEAAGGEFVLEAGEHFLPKPFGPRPLLEMVRTALGREATPA